MNPRRAFLRRSTALAVMAAASGAPLATRAAGKPVRIGVLHPVTGALAYSGQQCRLGALLAIEDINASGGIRSLGGAPLETVLGDAQSRPEAGSAEVEKMNEAGVSAILGAYASAICLATTQTAAKYGLPHVVDVGVADQIVERGLPNTFRFGPGYRVCSMAAVDGLAALNAAAGKPAKTVMIVHEESLFGTGTAQLLQKELPARGFEVREVIKHANPTHDFNNIVLRMRSVNPDIVIPANYYNEYALLLRTMKQQRIRPKAIYSVLGGAASSYKFLKEFPTIAEGIIDCNHWFDPKDLHLRDRREALREAEAIARRTRLQSQLDKPAAALTVAGRKRLELARALAARPRLLLLDEALAGLNPSEIDEMIPVVREIAASGVTVLMIEHVMRAVMSLAEHVWVLAQGSLLASGTPREVTTDPAVIEAYLGHGSARRLAANVTCAASAR